MTIIRPNNNKKLLNLIIGLLSGFFGVVLLGGIWMYGTTVSLRHDISKLQDDIQQTEVRNSELKNQIYGILNPRNLESVAGARGLIKDKNPEFIQISVNQGITSL